MSLYTSSQWKQFRETIIDSDGHRCTNCERTDKEVTLQVHHLKYEKDRLPWEYATKDCVTLCKGCHAAEHGIIPPNFGWEFIGDEDLEDLIGTCQKCSTSIRYVFYIFHPNWGTMEVGTHCCDNLTDSQVASNKRESLNKYKSRKKRFLSSSRWSMEKGIWKIKQGTFEVNIQEVNSAYYITIHELKSKKPYKNLESAKTSAFDVIESGELINYLEEHKIKFDSPKKKSE